jgi:acetyl-CoA carboxylase biotin carboxyl carrier protein
MAEKKNLAGAENGWHLKDIQKLIDLLIERDVAEFEMEKEGVRIRVRRAESRAPALAAAPPTIISPAVLPLTIPAATAPVSASPAPVTAQTAAPAVPAETAPAAAEETSPETSESLYIIKSPLVGTFYGSPSPNAEAFVKPGDAVRVGQVLCIIEAMKLMNEIESEVGGEIVRIYVENGQPVEYGQSLFAIKPSLKR